MNLFESVAQTEVPREILCTGAVKLRGFAQKYQTELFAGLREVAAKAPFRHMVTPGGFRMSVAMTNCGAQGWISDETAYPYDRVDPETKKAWPEMPDRFLKLASSAAAEAGFDKFFLDACLINRYEPGSKLSLHQDRNERDFDEPIVSVSLGVSATFLFGGLRRSDKTERIPVEHGDVIVWGGPARLRYHGVMPLRKAFIRWLAATASISHSARRRKPTCLLATQVERRAENRKKTPSTLTDRAFVLATLQEMVNSGLAFRRTRSEHQSELCLLSGEVFILDKLGIKRVL